MTETTRDRAEYQSEYSKQHKTTHVRPRLTFTTPEFEKIEKIALHYEMKPASFIRQLCLSFTEAKQLDTPAQKKEIQEMKRLLKGIGYNLNQIARHSHTIGRVLDENEVLSHIRQLEECVVKEIRREKD